MPSLDRVLPPRLALLGVATLLLLATPVTIAAHAAHARALCGVAGAASVVLTLLALRRRPPNALRSRGVRIAVAVLVGLTGLLSIGVGLETAGSPPAGFYHWDSGLFNADNARLVAHGENPYTADGRLRRLVRLDPKVAWTVVARGAYAGATRAPSTEDVTAEVQARLRSGAPLAPELDPRIMHSYPAGSFLVDVPSVLLGQRTTALSSLALLVAFLLAIVAPLPPAVRLAGLAVACANLIEVSETVRGAFEITAFLPAVLAFRWFDRRVVSGVLLGLACAVKQMVWPLPLLALVIAWRQSGRRDALVRSATALAGFLVPNLPFALASPHAWLESLFVPVSLPMLPDGVGLVALSTAGPLPLMPKGIYAIAELTALIGVAAWFGLARRPPRRELALPLCLVPFLLAWRSLSSYFWILPLLSLPALAPLLAAEIAPAVPRRWRLALPLRERPG